MTLLKEMDETLNEMQDEMTTQGLMTWEINDYLKEMIYQIPPEE